MEEVIEVTRSQLIKAFDTWEREAKAGDWATKKVLDTNEASVDYLISLLKA